MCVSTHIIHRYDIYFSKEREREEEVLSLSLFSVYTTHIHTLGNSMTAQLPRQTLSLSLSLSLSLLARSLALAPSPLSFCLSDTHTHTHTHTHYLSRCCFLLTLLKREEKRRGRERGTRRDIGERQTREGRERVCVCDRDNIQT